MPSETDVDFFFFVGKGLPFVPSARGSLPQINLDSDAESDLAVGVLRWLSRYL